MAHKTRLKLHSSILKSDEICGWVIPAVDLIVDEYPTEPVDGFRVILTTDNKIYTYSSSSGVWQLDSQTTNLINGLGVIYKGNLEDDIYRYSETEGEWIPIVFSRNYHDTLPDVDDVRVGDTWVDPITLEEYRLFEVEPGVKFWVETTSPGIVSGTPIEGGETAASPKAIKLAIL